MYLLLFNVVLVAYFAFKLTLDLSITTDRLTKIFIIKSDYQYFLLLGLIFFIDVANQGYIFGILIYIITLMTFGILRSVLILIAAILLFSFLSYSIALVLLFFVWAFSFLIIDIRRREFMKIDIF